jgi:hypothetical protein
MRRMIGNAQHMVEDIVDVAHARRFAVGLDVGDDARGDIVEIDTLEAIEVQHGGGALGGVVGAEAQQRETTFLKRLREKIAVQSGVGHFEMLP